MTSGWLPLEWVPQPIAQRDWPRRLSILGFYLPRCEPRRIDPGARIHQSVFDRIDADPTYRPVNLPTKDKILIEVQKPGRHKR